jgi:hypothetical protein
MRPDILKVFIGYDPVESVAWHTMAHSIFERSSLPVSIIPLNLKNLNGIYSRNRDPRQSNDFSFSRFLVPYLCNYEGFAVFFDCDMMIRTDISKIFDEGYNNADKAIHVVKHDYAPKNTVKFLNNVQYSYPRKNWSSVVLWNCNHKSNRIVTPEFVNFEAPEILHRFSWLKDEEIGSLDIRWNWLVGEYENPPPDVFNVHWTVGGPYFNEYSDADFSSEWFQENEKMNFCAQKK